MKITVLVNTLSSISPFIYPNHVHFFVQATKKFPGIQWNFFTPPRMSIDTARNNAAKLALESDSDYLMFIDDDVLVPATALEKLIAADKDIVAGLVVIRGYPFNNMAFKFIGPEALTFYNDLPLEKECANAHTKYDLSCESCRASKLQTLVKVGAVGFSCCLIKTDVLKAMEPPFFITGVNHTEDVYFCLKTLELTPNPEIYLHTDVPCGHLLNPEPIEWGSRHKMQEFYKETVIDAGERNISHIERCLAKMG
jgi:hypothetical protein